MIAVLFGGCSPEYGVSLQSAAAVLRHMDQSRYEPVMVGISQAGDWFHYTGPVDSIESDTWHNAETCVPAVMRPDRSAPALLVLGPEGMQKVRLDADKNGGPCAANKFLAAGRAANFQAAPKIFLLGY